MLFIIKPIKKFCVLQALNFYNLFQMDDYNGYTIYNTLLRKSVYSLKKNYALLKI
jgi:hypothetical protein